MDEEQLILEVQRNPVLYNKSHPMFKDARKKKDIWNEIGSKVEVSDCKLGVNLELEYGTVKSHRVAYKVQTFTSRLFDITMYLYKSCELALNKLPLDKSFLLYVIFISMASLEARFPDSRRACMAAALVSYPISSELAALDEVFCN
ncbi:Hypothetical predicted protein [Paramuricea clavata]|uniref:Uncharacterized protein n=1 Tax=Paramuricea clavata TaxID=317549 RepID=A0A6S7FZC9_PARCT|nr:Hypothetical predicted protein [Paramuricea clavata]